MKNIIALNSAKPQLRKDVGMMEDKEVQKQ